MYTNSDCKYKTYEFKKEGLHGRSTKNKQFNLLYINIHKRIRWRIWSERSGRISRCPVFVLLNKMSVVDEVEHSRHLSQTIHTIYQKDMLSLIENGLLSWNPWRVGASCCFCRVDIILMSKPLVKWWELSIVKKVAYEWWLKLENAKGLSMSRLLPKTF